MLMFSAKKSLKSLQEKADKFHLAKNLYNIFLPLYSVQMYYYTVAQWSNPQSTTKLDLP